MLKKILILKITVLLFFSCSLSSDNKSLNSLENKPLENNRGHFYVKENIFGTKTRSTSEIKEPESSRSILHPDWASLEIISVVANSTYDKALYPPENLSDNNPDTQWISATVGESHWFYVDLGEEKTVEALEFEWGSYMGEVYDATYYSVYSSSTDPGTEGNIVWNYEYSVTNSNENNDIIIKKMRTRFVAVLLQTSRRDTKAYILNDFKVHGFVDDPIIYFWDTNLDSIIRNIIGKSSTETIYRSDVAYINTLYAYNSNIQNLHGIENLKSLTELYLDSNYINDLWPLSNLVNLKYLDIGNNSGINSYSDLTTLTALEGLDISDNYLTSSDLTEISKISNLKSLKINNPLGNGFDMTQLTNLANLESLSIAYWPAFELSTLKNFNNLRVLRLTGNSISDISELKSLTNLEYLYLNVNSVTDISILKNFSKLKSLNLDFCPITDISILGNLTNLEVLRFFGCSLSDITPLATLTNLSDLDIRDNGMTIDKTSISSNYAIIKALLDKGADVDYEYGNIIIE